MPTLVLHESQIRYICARDGKIEPTISAVDDPDMMKYGLSVFIPGYACKLSDEGFDLFSVRIMSNCWENFCIDEAKFWQDAQNTLRKLERNSDVFDRSSQH
eukprot:766986-Hanusia_phi.AAC.1